MIEIQIQVKSEDIYFVVIAFKLFSTLKWKWQEIENASNTYPWVYDLIYSNSNINENENEGLSISNWG